ncbi:MAG: NifU family protein [Gemmatimonadota bacterium]|jgi:Fe/S biogenesis protein NfuA|nr:NifU family protein [Gemmatimonadota bacterium]
MIEITEDARAKIQSLVDAEVVRSPALRIALAPGDDGRSPLERPYAISLVEREDKARTEIAINVEGIRVLLNLDTSTLLGGAKVDWVAAGGGFRVDTPRVEPPLRAPSGSAEISHPLAERVQRVIDEQINPGIAAHGGVVEMVDLDDDTLYLRMGGGCQGCAASQATLRQGVERMVREAVPEIEEIIDITDHTAGANPYYA